MECPKCKGKKLMSSQKKGKDPEWVCMGCKHKFPRIIKGKKNPVIGGNE